MADNTIPNTQRFKATIIHDAIQTLGTTTVKYIPSLQQSPSTFRQSILPILPQVDYNHQLYSLLANTPTEQLSYEERILRRRNLYVDCLIDDQLPPFPTNDQMINYEIRNLLNFYAQKWNVTQDLLFVNLNRLFTILPQLTLQDFIIKNYELSIQEWFIILEFYLQMNEQCFFMKTCTFRNSKPRDIFEGLFCINNPPSTQYSMKQCRDQSCRFCYERLDLTKRVEPAMNFSKNQIHCFVNHYQVYLNCDVTCTTSDIIYALTCPCHEYDYVGRCKIPFRDRMCRHRMYGCRLMSNFFIGQTVADRLQHERESNPIICDAHVKLYQHSLECPVALRIFLKHDPDYWCFVPMTIEQAMIDNTNLTPEEKHILTTYILPNSQDIPNESQKYLRDTILVRWCIDHVPQPSIPNYQFSLRQKVEQFDFFLHKLDLHSSRFLDLYNAAIVMALPENCSTEIRHSIQALLIAYTEPKLNITTTINEKDDHSILKSHKHYYEYLIHPHLR